MPYIPKKRRKAFDPFLEKIAREIEKPRGAQLLYL